MTPGERARAGSGGGWVEALPIKNGRQGGPQRPVSDALTAADVRPQSITFVIYGAPRTKKNSLRILRGRSGTPFVAQSRQANAWENAAALQLQARSRNLPAWVRGPVNLRALIYRERDIGDLGNFIAAVCDALQASGVVANDREIRGFDGSRLLVDRHAPRVELTLTPLEDA
jgi:Holliday junction resolvase RusA-like endonuclease